MDAQNLVGSRESTQLEKTFRIINMYELAVKSKPLGLPKESQTWGEELGERALNVPIKRGKTVYDIENAVRTELRKEPK